MSIFANQNKKIMKKLTILMVFCLLFAVVGEAFAGRTKHTKRRSKARTHLVSKGRKNHKKAKRVIGYVPREVADTSSVLCEDTCSHVHGIDMSHYQGDVFWETVSNNTPMAYVYLKATEGGDRIDEKFERNIVMAHVHGLKVGSYHFYRPNVNWREQFEFMKRIVRIEEQDLVPLIDIEKFGGGSRFVSDLREFVLAVERHYGRKPLLYTYQNFYNKHLRGQFPDYPWMIACYSDNQPVLSDGQPYIMWQYSCKGRLSGIRGDVDRSCLMESYSLRQLKM